MKILFDHPNPFLLAHGGFQIQIEQTKRALESIGIEVEWLRWWDDRQSGTIIHYFGRPGADYIRLAHQKGMKVVMATLHGGLGARSAPARMAQKTLMLLASKFLPGSLLYRLAWESYRIADACVVLTGWERYLVETMYGSPHGRIHVVPNGVEEVFIGNRPVPRGKWLVTTASILPVKRVLETARAAVKAQVPYWVIGKPFSETDPYFRAFCHVQSRHPDLIRYEGPILDRAKVAEIYREARGFVLLSRWESLSLSALEAAAGGCPVLLGDLPWAHSVFGEHVQYCPVSNSLATTAKALREFYRAAPNLKPPPQPQTWREVAGLLKAVYEEIQAPRGKFPNAGGQ